MPLSKFIRYTCVYVFCHVNYFFISEYNMRLHTQSAWMFGTKDTLLTRESISGNVRADLQTENNTEDHARAENITSLQTEISEQGPL